MKNKNKFFEEVLLPDTSGFAQRYILFKHAIYAKGQFTYSIYDVAINIFSVSSSLGKAKMDQCFSIYTVDLIDQWTRAFGEGFVLSRRSIKQKCHLTTVPRSTLNNNKPKKKNMACFAERSLRQVNKE